MPELPQPISVGDEYAKAIYGQLSGEGITTDNADVLAKLDEINTDQLAKLDELIAVMQQVADNTIPRTMRISKVQAETGEAQDVQLREPAPGPAKPLREPKPDPELAAAEQQVEQKPAARKPRAADTSGASKPAARKTGGKSAKPKPTADGDA